MPRLLEDPLPGTSKQRHQMPEEQLEDMIRQAEAAKAKIFATPGNVNNNFGTLGVQQLLSPSALVDEGYIVVGAHLDENTVAKINKGEYVDFGKLLPCDKVMAEEDNRMEVVVRNGKAFWVPVSSAVSINSFTKWEQAFRVYSNIYCKSNPHRSAELIEYNHIIHTIAMAYMWENVYQYDKEF